MDALSIQNALTVDLICVALFLIIAIRVHPPVVHPSWTFLATHLLIVTSRLLQLSAGRKPMTQNFTWPVALPEIVRAAIASDIGLAAWVLGWMVVLGMRRRVPKSRLGAQLVPPQLVPPKLVTAVALSAVALGAFSMALGGPQTRGAAGGSLLDLGYIKAASSWPAWGMVLLHYSYGFRPWLLVLTVVVFFFCGVYNLARFVVILPVAFLGFLWIGSRRRRGLSKVTPLVGAVLLWCLWLPLKPFFDSIWHGDSLTDAGSRAATYVINGFETRGESGDTQYLDMIACWMTVMDVNDYKLWGSSILPLFVGPIPKMWWPGKPRLNQYLYDENLSSRPMAFAGMTPGLVGEGYANGGYAGVVLYFFFVGFFYAKIFDGNTLLVRGSARQLLYLEFLCTLPMVMRDGLIAGVMYPLVHCAPISFVVVCSLLLIKTHHRQKADVPPMPSLDGSFPERTGRVEVLTQNIRRRR